jgi:hypothetical protein
MPKKKGCKDFGNSAAAVLFNVKINQSGGEKEGMKKKIKKLKN